MKHYRVQCTRARKKEWKKERKKERQKKNRIPDEICSSKKGIRAEESRVNRGEHAFARNSNPSRAFFTHASHSRTTTTTTTSRRDYAYVRGDTSRMRASEHAREYRRDRPPDMIPARASKRSLFADDSIAFVVRPRTRCNVDLTSYETSCRVKWNNSLGNEKFHRIFTTLEAIPLEIFVSRDL